MININFSDSFRAGSSDKVYYFPTDRDEATTTRYYGFTTDKGTWYIIKDVTTTGATRYVSGKTDYPTNWTNRASLTYNYVYEM